MLTGGLCMRCALKWCHQSSTSPVVGQMDEWSDASKRSRSYRKSATISYFDEHYWCAECGDPAVFSAVDQKYTFEVKKRYFLQRRTLCNPCWNKHRRKPTEGD